MKRLLFAVLLLAACSNPTEPKPKYANIYGEFWILFGSIKYSGKAEMQYNGETYNSTLTGPTAKSDPFNSYYNFTFENIEVSKGKSATIAIKLMNGFGAETVVDDTTMTLTAGADSLFMSMVNL